MMILLAIKDNTEYVRFVGEHWELCPVNKASVFPLTEADRVKSLLAVLHEQGYRQATLIQLTITEKPYRD